VEYSLKEALVLQRAVAVADRLRQIDQSNRIAYKLKRLEDLLARRISLMCVWSGISQTSSCSHTSPYHPGLRLCRVREQAYLLEVARCIAEDLRREGDAAVVGIELLKAFEERIAAKLVANVRRRSCSVKGATFSSFPTNRSLALSLAVSRLAGKW
jgi:hypothetical protein